MPMTTETVSQNGSGLVFENWYSANVTDAYKAAILAAEHDLQSHFTDSVKVVMSFDLQDLGAGVSERNDYNLVHVSYDTLAAALKAHATTANDQLAIAGLPTSDPSHGLGFDLAAPQARILGLADQTFSIDDAVTLNKALGFTFGQDAVGVIEHAITQGAFGRLGSLGQQGAAFSPTDLFRFDASGHHDFTGGADGQASFFGVDGDHVSSFQFHNSVNTAGVSDGLELADWDHTTGDAFGPGAAGVGGTLSDVDLQVLDVLGWTPSATTAAATTVPAAAVHTQAVDTAEHLPMLVTNDGWAFQL